MHLRIHHQTAFSFAEPVSLSPHLLYLRPREYSLQRLHRFDLSIQPEPILSKAIDPLDNELWTARFPELTDNLTINSEAIVETLGSNPFAFVVKDYAIKSPFAYEPSLKFPLSPYLAPPFDDTQRELQQWIDRHFTTRPTGTVEMLTAFSQLIFTRLTYIRRDEPGIQPSTITLGQGKGACRDFAVLFMELCRTLGLAARFVSGYLYAPSSEDERIVGAMHAWAEVYLPGAGWRGLDPTQGVWCDDHYVSVAHSAQAENVNPIQGIYYGDKSIASELEASVTVEPCPSPDE